MVGEKAALFDEAEMQAMEVLKVHPVAALFPMMTEEELDDLAVDIKANGLIHPLVISPGGTLIDGRNRLEACHRAGVEPTWATLAEDQDAVAFILSANVNRRHLSKGQQAMAHVKALSFNERPQEEIALVSGLSMGYIGQAAVVLKYAPDLVGGVLSGAKPLNDAYKQARERKSEGESDEAKQEELRLKAPDLYALVVEERMSLAEAVAAYQQRVKVERDRKERHTNYLATSLGHLWSLFHGKDGPADLRGDWIPEANPLGGQSALSNLWTAKGIRECALNLEHLADEVERNGGRL